MNPLHTFLPLTKILNGICIGILCLSLSACGDSSEKENHHMEERGFFSRMIHSIWHIFKSGGDKIPYIDDAEKVEFEKRKEGAELIQKEAEVSGNLYKEYTGHEKGEKKEDKKPEIDLGKLEDQVAPLPEPQKLEEIDKNSPIKEEMKKNATLNNLETGATLMHDLNQKKIDSDPQFPLSNTLEDEKNAKEPTDLHEVSKAHAEPTLAQKKASLEMADVMPGIITGAPAA
jgi:hypothetical protein